MIFCFCWKRARVVYRACLENKCGFTATRGSNPLASAIRRAHGLRPEFGECHEFIEGVYLTRCLS